MIALDDDVTDLEFTIPTGLAFALCWFHDCPVCLTGMGKRVVCPCCGLDISPILDAMEMEDEP